MIERIEISESRKHPWWFKFPTLVVNDKLHIVPNAKGISATEATEVYSLAQQLLFRQITEEFERAKCNTIVTPNNEQSRVSADQSDKELPHVVAVNPVLLGALPQEVETAMETYILQPDDRNLATMSRSLKRRIPEEMPLLVSIGKRLFRRLGIGNDLKGTDQNFVNIIFVQDNKGLIEKLPAQAKQLLGWSLMCKEGAFKEAIVPYKVNDGQGIEFPHDPILVTLDGAHPFMEAQALAQQLMVIGSSRSVGAAEVLEKAHPISRLEWRRSKVVKGLRYLGKFLDDKGRDLISPPVAIHKLARGRKLIRFLKKVAGFSRQAEGAFMALDPEIQTDALDVPWTGVPVVTASGKFGAIKTKLGYKDLVAVLPMKKTQPEDEAKVGIIPIAGQKSRGPSVEAEEFTYPLLELALEDPDKYLIRLQKVKDGYVRSPEGNRVVPLVRGVIHLHRGTSISEDTQDIFEVDTSEFPHFGCGVDQMQEMSKRVIKKGTDRYIERGRKDKAAISYVSDHGFNIVLFWAEDENGIIPEDPVDLLKKAISKGNLRFTREVPQRHNYHALDDYYYRLGVA